MGTFVELDDVESIICSSEDMAKTNTGFF